MKNILKTTLLIATSTIIISGQISTAQSDRNSNRSNSSTEKTTTNKRFWEVSLPSGNYMVALDRISAVSKHSYLVNKSLIVHEVNIQVQGSGFVRFYSYDIAAGSANPMKNLLKRGKELIGQIGKRTGIDVNTIVEKEYPITTHKQTIEYRLFDQDELDQLHASIKRAWTENRGRLLTIK